MNRISKSIDLIQPSYDVIVIGSGYGGAISASRLARAGQKVCLLERGKEILPGDFPDTLIEATEQMQLDTPNGKIGSCTGLYNIHVNKQQNVVVGCGLGGTSLINANVSLEPRPEVFDNPRWPDDIRAHKSTLLQQGFERAREMLKPNPYPNRGQYPPLNKTLAHQKSAQFMGEGDNFSLVPLNIVFDKLDGDINHVGVPQPPCTNCGDCVSGCNYGSKSTTQMNYLPDAYNHGADIFCQTNVSHVEKVADGWLVHFNPLGLGREKFDAPSQFVKAEVVILSAGTLGSTEILLRSTEKGLTTSNQLGKNFSANGDILGFGYNTDQPIHGIGFGEKKRGEVPDVGPCITSFIDMRHGDKRASRMVIEEGSLPGAISPLVGSVLRTAAELIGQDTDSGLWDAAKEKARILQSTFQGAYSGAVDNSQTYLIMSHDDDLGEMSLQDNRLLIDWQADGEQPNYFNGSENLRKATQALGGDYIKNPIWTKTLGRSVITVHPLGGCVMGKDAEQGVTNHKNQVFSGTEGTDVHQGLYVSDGAVIPTSLAVNPLLTISALAERCCVLIAQDYGWTFNYDLPSKPPVSDSAPLSPETLGIEFTETMQGYISKNPVPGDSLDSFEASAKAGQAADSSIKFTLTIASHDLDQLTKNPQHNARMNGTLEATVLSEQPLTVTDGAFNLFVRYPETPDTKRMNYNMLLTSSAGDNFYFSAYKQVKDSNITTLWHDTSTLYVTIHQGCDPTGEILCKGVMHIKPNDFAKQMTTLKVLNAQNALEKLKATARFGQYFAGALWQSYGGIFSHQPRFNPDVPPRKKRPLNTAAPEVYHFNTEDGVSLRLTRYQGGRKGPVMLVHGLGVSAGIFTTDTIPTNLVEYLYAHGYDVWALDFRVSIDLPAAQQQSNGDQVAQYDFPAAVNTIQRITGKDSVQAIVHCYGATTFFMSMLAGLQGIRSIVASQIATDAILPLSTRIKTGLHVPGIIEKLGFDSMTAYTDTSAGWLEKLYDKGLELNALTQAQGKCNNPVCHRITFLYSSLYRHETLNDQLHNNLHELFGESNITTLKHLSEICRHRHLISAEGDELYMPHLDRLNLPICFISGENNECYLPESTRITYDKLCERHGAEQYSRHVIPGYGHIDCIFGRDAYKEVYPLMLAHLEQTAE